MCFLLTFPDQDGGLRFLPHSSQVATVVGPPNITFGHFTVAGEQTLGGCFKYEALGLLQQNPKPNHATHIPEKVSFSYVFMFYLLFK